MASATATPTVHHLTSIQPDGSIWLFGATDEDGNTLTFYSDHRPARGLCEGLASQVRSAAAEEDIEIPRSVPDGALVSCAYVELEPGECMGMQMPNVHFAGLNTDRLKQIIKRY
jgi:hypothetical protein